MNVVTHLWGFVSANAAGFAWRALIGVLIVIVAILVARALGAAAQRALARGRVQTLAPAVRGLIKLVVIGAGVVTALDQVGINVATVLAGAGVAGLAVGFGAQTLVKDVISGFFIVFDGVIEVGDEVKIGEASGVVEAVGLRLTQVRSFDGRLWYIPNGQIAVVGNASRGWTRAVVHVGLASGQDVPKALDVLQKVGDSYASEHSAQVLEPPQAEGILAPQGAGELPLRLVLKLRGSGRTAVEHQLRERVHDALTAASLQAHL